MLSLSRNFITRSLIRLRPLHTTATSFSASKSPLYVLRQKTGLTYTLCREALDKHDNNVEEAEAWLKAHALAHGIQKASKVRDRSAREGLVCLSLPNHNHSITVVELNCETDFVAKNQLFKDFAIDITEQICANFRGTTFNFPDQSVIKGSKQNEDLTKGIEDQIVPLITKLGENIKLSRAVQLFPSKPDQHIRLFGCIHSQAASRETPDYKILAGRFGAIVALKNLCESQKISHESMQVFGDKLCRHVIGFNPSYIELPASVRKHLEDMQKEREELRSNIENVDDGMPHDQEDTQESSVNRDDWPSIMDQTLIMTDDLSVRDFCKMNNISIEFFTRFECGMDS